VNVVQSNLFENLKTGDSPDPTQRGSAIREED